jgi:hypothetical protein
MVAWCLELDGRQDKDEFAKPIVGRGTGTAVNPVAVFSLVRFQEKEMRKRLKGKDCFEGGLMGLYDFGAQCLLDAGGCQVR